MRRARSADSCRTAASACITKTSWTSTAASASARAWWLRGDRQSAIQVSGISNSSYWVNRYDPMVFPAINGHYLERSWMSVNASPLEGGLPGSHRVDEHADGLDHDRRVFDHDVVSRVRVGDAHRAGHERRELVLGPRVRLVDDRAEVRRRVGRQLTGLDELRDDVDELVAGREHDDWHGPYRCRSGRPCDRAAERVRDEDVRARYVGRLQQGDEVVHPVLGTGRLGHRVAPAEGLVEVRRTGSVVGAHPRRLLDVVVDRRTLLISSVPQVRRRVRTRDEQHGG